MPLGRFIPPAQALPFLPFANLDDLITACKLSLSQGLGDVVCLSPEGSKKPVYRINVFACQQRIQNTQPSVS